ncbi:proline-rich protein 5-like isoform X4 [Alosa sapidissima]|uniref:proline-rich protein 5-like isoform X1 n=3 Tax=Alosa sapidissima TaxID=34773 RepID=UPI001C098D43|nr:proline-rich protein 5-like isoform X1 [Alosa sapidissima]XP_041935161.1 proline-rich protein 5-like isoform X1 [Alosa sapidissima]XP_041935162.1 proline-rich protein 5-like isoform X3 [Alosa sapidissima]XP_041935163.1 proline-rich protein 5-like isoform X4 [Alosa sapidissima]
MHTHTHTPMERDGRSFRRLKLMSSPSLSEKSTTEERSEQHRAGANATWNSIHNAVIAVFQRKVLGENELYTLNEGVRQLLKTELGSFFTEYLQNQLLTKGMVILRDKIRFYEGQKLLDSLAETWDFFFCDVLSMLQAIFYPVQGKEPSVRQLALLHFRNIITLNIKLEDALCRPRARVPPSITQMMLILQGVHESKGVTDDYLKLESLVQRVVSPYLGSHGLYSHDGSVSHCSCVLEKRLQRRWPKSSSDPPAKNPVVRSKSYNIPMLTPVAEYDPEIGLCAGGSLGLRRHSIGEMTCCLEEPGGQASDHSPSVQRRGANDGADSPSPSLLPDHSPPRLSGSGSFRLTSRGQRSPALSKETPPSCASISSSPETIVDQILESMDSDPEGIFIDFQRCSSSSSFGHEGRQSVV